MPDFCLIYIISFTIPSPTIPPAYLIKQINGVRNASHKRRRAENIANLLHNRLGRHHHPRLNVTIFVRRRDAHVDDSAVRLLSGVRRGTRFDTTENASPIAGDLDFVFGETLGAQKLLLLLKGISFDARIL